MDIFDLYDRFSINLCQDTTNNIRDLIKTTEEKLKELASEVVTNSSTKSNSGKNIRNQLGEAANKTALGRSDVLFNVSGEIKEGVN